MKIKIPLLAVLIPILLLNSFIQAAEKKSNQPNIIFFITDDMLPHHFNFLSGTKRKILTPNIERLAKGGTVMLNQYTVSPLCTPSRYSCLMGRYPSRADNPWFEQITKKNHGQTYVEFNTHIIKTDQNIARRLQKAGYVTGFVGKNHVVEVSGLKRAKNYDSSAKLPENVSFLKANHDRVCQVIREVGFDYVDHVYHNNPDFLGLFEVAVHNMDWITEGGINFIERYHKSKKPMFLYFATTLPHGPTEADRAWNANPLLSAVGYLDKAPHVQPARETIPQRIAAAGLKVTDDACNMLWVDDALGALVDELEKVGELDNTVIFFFNDQWMESKGTVYQGGTHTPSIVWRKGGFPVGATCDALVSSIDFTPTILDITQVPYKKTDFDGESFLPYLNGEKQDLGRILYFELGYGRGIIKGNWKYMEIRYPEAITNMTMAERKKLLDDWNANRIRKHMEIVTTDPTAGFSHLTAIPGGGHAEAHSTGTKHYPGYYDPDQLYDLSKDPREQKNLAKDPEMKAKLEEMQREMRKVLDTLPGEFPE
jgi:arylsulfatase A-like enzyme